MFLYCKYLIILVSRRYNYFSCIAIIFITEEFFDEKCREVLEIIRFEDGDAFCVGSVLLGQTSYV